MKKFLLVLMLGVFTLGAVVSCTPESKVEKDELQTDPNENCPPNDRNCNGIPDNQEGGN